jgi:hypothetical protein
MGKTQGGRRSPTPALLKEREAFLKCKYKAVKMCYKNLF